MDRFEGFIQLLEEIEVDSSLIDFETFEYLIESMVDMEEEEEKIEFLDSFLPEISSNENIDMVVSFLNTPQQDDKNEEEEEEEGKEMIDVNLFKVASSSLEDHENDITTTNSSNTNHSSFHKDIEAFVPMFSPPLSEEMVRFVICDHLGLRGEKEEIKRERERIVGVLEHLVTTPSALQEMQKSLNSQKRVKEEEEEKRRESNRRVMERYGFEAVSLLPTNSSTTSSYKNHKNNNKKDRRRKKRERQPNTRQIRFRNSEVVTNSGQKSVDVGVNREEWDGGSRGKVTSKGKRGKGWV